jgi:uncharacterized protein (TIGR03118 family)
MSHDVAPTPYPNLSQLMTNIQHAAQPFEKTVADGSGVGCFAAAPSGPATFPLHSALESRRLLAVVHHQLDALVRCLSRRSGLDEQLPAHYVTFNVQAIGNDIVVTYVLHQEGAQFETDGPGLGFIDIYSSSGRLLQRPEHGDWLNAPWGVALAPLDFGRFSHDLLIGQFAGGGDTPSSGVIAAYDLATGKFDGLLLDASGKPLTINGIRTLSPGNVSPSNNDAASAPAAEMYFTAGPNHGSGGLFLVT